MRMQIDSGSAFRWPPLFRPPDAARTTLPIRPLLASPAAPQAPQINRPPARSTPAAPADRLHPLVQFHTTLGDITIKLDAEHAPITVDNFLAYLDQGQYDNTLFHQVLPGVAILGGGYDTFGKEKPTLPPIRNEAHNGIKNRRGTIAMARRPDMVDSSTCQFFINLADNPNLDYKKPAAQVVDFRKVKGPRRLQSARRRRLRLLRVRRSRVGNGRCRPDRQSGRA